MLVLDYLYPFFLHFNYSYDINCSIRLLMPIIKLRMYKQGYNDERTYYNSTQ